MRQTTGTAPIPHTRVLASPLLCVQCTHNRLNICMFQCNHYLTRQDCPGNHVSHQSSVAVASSTVCALHPASLCPSSCAPHGKHLREPARLEHGQHEQHVGARVDQVAQRLVVGEQQARAVRVCARQLLRQRVEVRLGIGH